MKFSNTSNKRLNTCHEDLQIIARKALSLGLVDFGIAEGERTLERQKQLVKEGKSKTLNSKHVNSPSMAFDVYGWINGKGSTYKPEHIIFIAGIILAVALDLKAKGEITHSVRWGGNWDRDGEVVTDQSFDDLVHFELE